MTQANPLPVEAGPTTPGQPKPKSRRPGSARTRTLVGLMLAALVLGMGTLAVIGLPSGHSLVFNTAWLAGFEAALAQGAIYPRHLPGLWFGLGGLDFFFYGPLPFYLAAGPARWLCGAGCDAPQVLAIAGALLWGLSAAGFWLFARRLTGPVAALAGALVYALMPYHLGMDWFTRQAFGEFAAYVFVPLVALGLHDCLRDGRMGVSFPLGLAGLVLCHLPTALLAGHVFAAVWLVGAVRHPLAGAVSGLRLAGLAAIGLALSGVYWLPALALLGDVSPEALYDTGALLTPEVWLLLRDGQLPDTLANLLTLLSLVASLIAGLAAAAVTASGRRGAVLQWVLVPVLLCLFLNTVLSAPVWANWIIDRVQFPFRLLVFSDLAAGLAMAFLVRALLCGLPARLPQLVALGGIGMLGLAILAQGPAIAKRLPEPDPALRMVGAPEYFPPAFFATVDTEARARGLWLWSYGEVVADLAAETRAPGGPVGMQATPRHWRAPEDLVELAGPTVFAVPYWQHMRAQTADGVALVAQADPQGWLMLDIPDGAGPVEVWLPHHWSEWAGMAASLLGLVTVGALGWRDRRLLHTDRPDPDHGTASQT